MRLIDRVRIAFEELADDLPVIVADPVAAQIDQLPGDTWEYSPPAEEYGRVAPPFNRFFVEAETAVNLDDVGGFGDQVVQRGVLVDVEDREDEGVRWVYLMTPFAWYQPTPGAIVSGLHTVNGRIGLGLDGEGHILDDLDAVQTYLFDSHPQTAAMMQSYTSFLPFVLKALSVLHQRTEVERVTHSRQVRRRHQRKHGREPAEYYLLKVTPFRPQSMSDVAQPTQSRRRRQHVVRGHFRYYSPERPLFGRYSGMVWVAEHERGDESLGRVRKDYLVDDG